MAAAIVTGASRGVGRAAALALAHRGFALGLVARSHDALDETRSLVEATGAAAVAVVADVTDTAAVQEAVGRVERELGPVSALVNNAGSLRAVGPVWEVDPHDWWADVRTSLGGAYALCRAVVPLMLPRGEGRIVNVTSYAGTRPAPYESAYACAKAALTNLTESLAASLEPRGLRAFAVAPGFTDTGMTRRLLESPAGARWLPELRGRQAIAPELSATLIARLAAGDADELSGRLLHALDDIEVLLARLPEIRRDDLYLPRVRRLPGA